MPKLKKCAALLLALALMLINLPALGAAPVRAAAADADYLPGEVVVAFAQGTTVQAAEDALAAAGCELLYALQPEEEAPILCAAPPAGQSVQAAVDALLALPGVQHAQPNYVYPMVEEEPVQEAGLQAPPASTRAALPAALSGDPLAQDGSQWHLDQIDVSGAWDVLDGTTAPKTRVAVLDTVIQLEHEDLAANLLAGLAIDCSDGTLQAYGEPSSSHGTHVAGLVGAVGGNGLGGAGVASGRGNQGVELVPVNVFRANAAGQMVASTTAMLVGIRYALACGADVINMSLGYTRNGSLNSYDVLLRDAVDEAAGFGVPIVCAAGNYATDTPFFPSDFANAIGVIALDNANVRTGTSNFGTDKFISAPGAALYSTSPFGTGYAQLSGTSMAAPVVSGVVAMMLYANPALSHSEILTILSSTAENLYAPGHDADSGWGLVKAGAAVQAAAATPTVPAAVTAVRLSQSEKEMKVGESTRMGGAALPRNAANRALTWASSAPDVATVDANGVITALAPGQASITATAVNGSSAVCALSVLQPVTGVALEAGSLILKVGQAQHLGATISPENASNTALRWSSSAPEVADVNGAGYIEAKQVGSAAITVRTEDGDFSATCTVTVLAAETGSIISSATHYTGSESVSWTIDARPDNFVRLEIAPSGGTPAALVRNREYTLSEGSAVITLMPGYLKSLPNGSYQIWAVFTFGTVESSFAIARNENSSPGSQPQPGSKPPEPESVAPSQAQGSPQTGDSSNSALWAIVTVACLVLLLGGGAAFLVIRRRPRK